MTASWRGPSDIWTPTVCHSVLPVMYGCCVAPLTHQSRSILPCWGTLQQDNGSLWPMLWNDKTPWGWGQKKLSLQGEGRVCFIRYHKVSNPAVALKWLNIVRKMLRKPNLDRAVTQRSGACFVYWRYNLFIESKRKNWTWPPFWSLSENTKSFLVLLY